MSPPTYFESIRQKAHQRWDQLEDDPDLAGPWRQLFSQVQSPRHVLSELLQNADDAGATEASADIRGGEFIFSHNGKDFTEDQFESLCRFGFSNKRTIHTIGFRGVGFKSTFSLGDEVRISTPTLCVSFHRNRFTEPNWIDTLTTTDGRTEVSIRIQDNGRLKELEKNLLEWVQSPTSLLFFENVRRLRIQGHEVAWTVRGKGPVGNSEWVSASLDSSTQYLRIRSPEVDFPEDVVDELINERQLFDDASGFPPSRVEIILGLEARLFVVLPTGVTTDLPFACNAPFIQDPARMKIKDPELSPTNRWLLGRVGELAAEAMIAWLEDSDQSVDARCEAYALVPDRCDPDNSIEAVTETIVKEGFKAGLEGKRFLMTESGLETAGSCLGVPQVLMSVWPPEMVSEGFCDGMPVLSRQIAGRQRTRLMYWGDVGDLTKPQVLQRLKTRSLICPESWHSLAILWNYLSEDIAGLRSYGIHNSARIIPVQGSEILHSRDDVIRLGDSTSLGTEDLDFLAPYMSILDREWTQYVGQPRGNIEAGGEDKEVERFNARLRACNQVLTTLGLSNASNGTQIIDKASSSFFQGETHQINEYVRLAHISASLNARTPVGFKFVTRNRKLKLPRFNIVADMQHDMEPLVDATWYGEHALHQKYDEPDSSITKEDWQTWLASDRSRLHTFVPITSKREPIFGRDNLYSELERRGMDPAWFHRLTFRYKADRFAVDDWDFDANHWEHWNIQSQEESSIEGQESIWDSVFSRIVAQPERYWANAVSARAVHISQQDTEASLTAQLLIPSWVLKLRGLACIRDNRGALRQPAELLRRTPKTEPLLAVESFVRSDYDTEATAPLLDLLGVRGEPTGPDGVLDRLKALSKSDIGPVEIQKWCYSLDQMYVDCSTEDVNKIKSAFANYELILTEDGGWRRTTDVYINPDENDVPGAIVIHPGLRGLALWSRIGVPDRPTVESALEWLMGLGSLVALKNDDIRRARSLLSRYPERIWETCGHWLSLDGHWMPVCDMEYSVNTQYAGPWNHLFPNIKNKTASFNMLSPELSQLRPFSELRSLSDVIDERLTEQSQTVSGPDGSTWMNTLGCCLERIALEDAAETSRIRTLGTRLAKTGQHRVDILETHPLIDGEPVGSARSMEALWKDDMLLVVSLSSSKEAKLVPDELARVLANEEIAAAVRTCFDRESGFISEYMEENFNLILAREAVEEGTVATEVADVPTPEGGQDEGRTDTNVATKSLSGIEPAAQVRPDERDPNQLTGEIGRDQPQEPLGQEIQDYQTVRSKEINDRPQTPDLASLFAKFKGFSVSGGEYVSSDGSRLLRDPATSFPWQIRSPVGSLVQHYWIKDHCIQKVPLELPAEVWRLCQDYPDEYPLVLTDIQGRPSVITGRDLNRMRDSKTITLYPASYRLVYGGEGID